MSCFVAQKIKNNKNIFIKGLNIKFGKNDVIDIKYISNNDFNIFQKYFESIGLKLHCDIFHILQICSLNDIDIDTKNTLNEKYKEIDKSVLKHFKRINPSNLAVRN